MHPSLQENVPLSQFRNNFDGQLGLGTDPMGACPSFITVFLGTAEPNDFAFTNHLLRKSFGRFRRYPAKLSKEISEVTFRYRDRADGDRVKHETLPAEEFLDRFLKHILPDEFRRVRHYGLLSNRDKHKRLARCRELLGYGGSRQPDDVPTNSAEWMLELLGVDIYCCPRCNEPLRCQRLPAVGGEVDSSEAPAPFPEFEAWDTS